MRDNIRNWIKGRVRLAIALLLLIALIVSGCAENAGDTVANSVRVAAVSGQVSFKRLGDSQDWVPAVSGMQLALSDTLTTQVASETDLDVDQNQHVLVGEQVRMVIETLLKSVNQSQVARLRVDTGALYIRIQRKLSTGEAFEIITPTTVMGVRGTEFVVAVRGGDTQVFVLEGTVQVALNPKDLKEISGKSYGDALPTASWVLVGQGEMLAVPWGTETIDQIKPLAIDFNKMPLDMLKALLKSDSENVAPYLDAIGTAEKAQQEALAVPDAKRSPDFIGIPKESEKPYVDPNTGHVYARVDLDLTIEEAIAYCLERGGHLITITSKEEQALAEAMMRNGSKFWYAIGLLQKPGSIEPKEGFEWVTGEAVTFTNWHKENGVETEPSNRSGLGSPENEVVMLNYEGSANWKYGDWNDMNLAEKLGEFGFLCEWDSVNHFYGQVDPQDNN